MKIKCNKCNSEYNIDASRIGPSGIKIKCPKCLNSFFVKQDGTISDVTTATPPPPPRDMSQESKPKIKPPETHEKLTTLPNAKSDVQTEAEKIENRPAAKSTISIDNLPDLPELPDLPDLPEIGDSTNDLLKTLDSEIGISKASSPSSLGEEKPSQSIESTGLDFGMINLEEAIATSITTQKTQEPFKPQPSQINVVETKKEGISVSTTQQVASSSTSKKYKVKRKSGKIFGPFDEETIVRMLVENKLLGNEEVSEDGISWQSISKIPEFQQAIQNMLENISSTTPPVAKQIEKSSQELPKIEDKKKVVVKKEGVKEPTKFDEYKEIIGEKIKEVREKYRGLPQKLKKAILYGIIFFSLLILWLIGYSIYTRIFGSRLTDVEQQNINNAISALYSGNYQEMMNSLTILKNMYGKLRYKTPVCEVISRIILYQRSFLLEKGNDDLLIKCIKEIKKEKIDTPDGLLALGLYYTLNKETENLKEVIKSLSSSRHYQNYIYAYQNLLNRNYAQAITEFENYLKQVPQDSLTMELIGEMYLSQNDSASAKKWFKMAIDTNHKNLRAAIELTKLNFLESDDPKTFINMLENIVTSSASSLHPLELARGEYLLAKMYFSTRKNEDAEKYFKNSISHSNGKVEYKIAYAEYLYNIEELDKAFDEYNSVIKQEPTNLNAKIGIVKIMIKQRKILNAHKTIMEVYSQNPSDPLVLLYKGKIEEELEKFKDAEQSYNQILSINKDFVDAKLALANLLIRQNRIEDGLTLLENIKKENPNNIDVLLMIGETFLKLKRIDPAIENLRNLIEIDNYHTHARFMLAKAYIEKQEYEEALKHLEVVKIQISKMPELNYYFGKAYLGLKKYNEAIDNLEAELKVNKQSVDVMVLLGKAYSLNNDHQKAIEMLNNAILMEGNNAIAYFELGMAYLRKGDKTSAVEALKQAANKSKDNIEFKFVFGKTMIENNMFNEGIEELKGVVKKVPDNPEYRYYLAMGYYLVKNYKAAIAEFTKVYSLDPNNESALFYIGKSYQSKKDYDKAIKTFKECIEKNSNNDKALLEIARTYELLEKYDQAIDYYEKTISKNPTSSLAYYRLGYIYKGKNNYPKAIRYFEQFLKIAPEDDLAQEVKDEIFDLKEALRSAEEEEKASKVRTKSGEEEEE